MLRRLALPRGRTALVSLLVAEGISSIGSKMSFLAIPWLVLVTTGSPTKMGLVGLAQTLPYVLSGIFGTPIADRFNVRLVSILNDFVLAAMVAAIALFAQVDFAILVTLAALVGAVQGVGDKAKRVLLQPVAEAANAPMPRVVTIVASLNRLNTVVGVALGGVVIAWLGPIGAIWLNAASYSICGAMVILLVNIPTAASNAGTPAAAATKEPYLKALRGGYEFLRKDRLLISLTGMMFMTNMFNQASAVVLVPMWVMREFGSPVALGWVSGAFALGAILGNLAFIGLVTRLPRYLTFIAGYLIGGSPRFLVLALSDDLAVVLGVTFVAGIAMSTINPIYGVLMFERVPRAMQARVFGLTGALTFGGIPLGGLVGAWFVQGLGLTGGLFLSGCLYFAATMSPIIGYRIWKQMDDPPLDPSGPARRVPAPLPDWVESLNSLSHRWLPVAVTGIAQPPVTVTLTHADRQWTVSARSGRRKLMDPQPIASTEVLQTIKVLDLPEVYEAVEAVHAADLRLAAREVEQLRAGLAAREATLAELGEARRRLTRPRDPEITYQDVDER